MNSLSAISLSGMSAAQTQLSASANNIANTLTPGYQRQAVVQQSDPAGGVSATVVRSSSEQSALVQDVVQQLQAKNAFLANLAVFRSNDQMMGVLVNLHA